MSSLVSEKKSIDSEIQSIDQTVLKIKENLAKQVKGLDDRVDILQKIKKEHKDQINYNKTVV
ncbi:hypothetical protein GW750_08910 [bacterium]|nr:hypothetical protein [bacterium]